MLMKKNLWLIVLVAIIAFGFISTYSDAYHNAKYDYTREIVLALMASSVTMIITSILLRQQTKSEEMKDTHSEIFRKKFEVYTDFLHYLILSFEDQVNKEDTVRQLEESFYKLIMFIQDQDTFDVIYDVVMDSLQNNNREDMGRVLFVLRDELGIHGLNFSNNQVSIAAMDKIFWKDLGVKMNKFCVVADSHRK